MADTETTTKSEGGPGRPREPVRVSRLALIGLAVALGGSLIVLAWPRMMAGFERLAGDYPLENVQRLVPVSPADLERLITSRERARAWTDDPQLAAQLGLAKLAQQRDRRPANGELSAARDAFTAALSRRPLDSHSWLRLAYIYFAEGRRTAIDAWRLATQTAPYRPDQLDGRIRLGLRLWPLLSRDDQDLVRQQIRALWGESPYRTMALGKRLNKRDVFGEALRLTPGAAEEFERQY